MKTFERKVASDGFNMVILNGFNPENTNERAKCVITGGGPNDKEVRAKMNVLVNKLNNAYAEWRREYGFID